MTTTEPWTILRLLEWTTNYLRDHGSTSARLDAEVLLSEARGCKRIDLYTAFDEVADERIRTAFRELVRRRAEGTPVAYLVGHREFYSLPFRVTSDVLIPRPESEQLVVMLLDIAKQLDIANQKRKNGQPLRIVDIGTGSGILAVCAACHLPSSHVVATDISSAALETARKNAVHHDVDDRIEFIESDLFRAVSPHERFDFVLSNPPYVSEAEFLELPVEVRDHEPYQALVSGQTGTEVISRLVPQAAEFLRPGGWLIMEISPMIHESVEEIIKLDGGFSSCEIKHDLANLPRTVVAQRRS
jgi:release factor glutamine methyltransferase